jgi:hypothetical protein
VCGVEGFDVPVCSIEIDEALKQQTSKALQCVWFSRSFTDINDVQGMDAYGNGLCSRSEIVL